MWRSWLARGVWDAEVEGSSPFTPTIQKARHFAGFFELLFVTSYREGAKELLIVIIC